MKALPVELLSSIFIKVLHLHLGDPLYDDWDDPAAVHATICCVCQKWNQLAKSTPSLWTFMKISYRASSHDVMKRRLGLSGNLPLNVSMWLCQGHVDEESLNVMLTLLVERVSRWNTLRVDATVEVPSVLRQWVPSELPNVVALSLALEVVEQVPEDDTDSREPFISAPRLTFCSSNSPVPFSLTHCPLLREYHAMGIGFGESEDLPRATLWKQLAITLCRECPQLEVLEVSEDGTVWEDDTSQDGSWPALSSLTTLRFDILASYETIRCILTEIKAPHLRLVEFQGVPVDNGIEDTSIPEIQFPTENDGRAFFSRMSMSQLVALLKRISKYNELKVEVDLASIVAGNRMGWRPGAEYLGLVSKALAELRSEWKWVQQNVPKVSWMVPSGEGSLKRLGGASLSFDEAIAYLDNRKALSLGIQEYYKRSGLVHQQ